jgi:hypothetical protein
MLRVTGARHPEVNNQVKPFHEIKLRDVVLIPIHKKTNLNPI